MRNRWSVWIVISSECSFDGVLYRSYKFLVPSIKPRWSPPQDNVLMQDLMGKCLKFFTKATNLYVNLLRWNVRWMTLYKTFFCLFFFFIVFCCCFFALLRRSEIQTYRTRHALNIFIRLVCILNMVGDYWKAVVWNWLHDKIEKLHWVSGS